MILAGEIKRIEDWYCKAGPKDKDCQWKDDYSAKEFAKLWFNKNEEILLPCKIKKLLENVFGQFEVLFGIPEHVTRIDQLPGGQRNHDMFLFCKNANGENFIVCIEAKVAEPLDERVNEKLKRAKENPNSKISKRIDLMKELLKMENTDISDLSYQLFTGSAGTIAEGENYNTKKCLFLILQILPELKISGRNESEKIEANYSDIKVFLNKNNARKILEDSESFIYELKTKNNNLKSYIGYLKINEKK